VVGPPTERVYKEQANNTYCVYNKYNGTNVIYECIYRQKAPVNDSNCQWWPDITNYICNIPYDYSGDIECMFNYGLETKWSENY
jgi:hypothetical protein